MQPNNQTAFVLADNEAPYANASGYGKIDVERKELLSKAYLMLTKLTDEQILTMFETLQGG